MSRPSPDPSSFHSLTPERVIGLTEEILGQHAMPVCRPLTSYINRVFEVQMEDGTAMVVKFYRPGRWSEDALVDEHRFVFELADAEIPVIAPWTDEEDQSLFEDRGMWFAFFPRMGGRPFEDPTPPMWQELGRTLARMHNVGDEQDPVDRLEWHPEECTAGHLDYILEHGGMDPDLRDAYEDEVHALIDGIAPLFDDLPFTRLHGDFHLANLLLRPDRAGIHLIDFDDMVLGPTVQDMWMLLPGRVADSELEIEHLLHGYQQFRPFARDSLRLVEPLRAMRFIHFTAWCVQQQRDGGVNRLARDFGTERWWRQELGELKRQKVEINMAL